MFIGDKSRMADRDMTETVIRQSAKLEIETKSVTAHICAMANAAPQQLPDEVVKEMRPERIGYRLRLLREALGLSPSEMADMLGIERTYWSRFENGRRAINDTTAALLVTTFGVTLDFLILGRADKLPVDLAMRIRQVSEK